MLYLLFTSGYNADGRADFADEAIRLARLLAELLPDQSEPEALLALMLLQTLPPRRPPRCPRSPGHLGPTGPVPLGSPVDPRGGRHPRWTSRGARGGSIRTSGEFAACLAGAPTVEGTDWRRIADYYDRLAQLQPTPVVELNRAVAHGYAYRPAEGLALLARIRDGGALQRYPLLVAAEAELTARAGDPVRAAALFRLAARTSPTADPNGGRCWSGRMSKSRWVQDRDGVRRGCRQTRC